MKLWPLYLAVIMTICPEAAETTLSEQKYDVQSAEIGFLQQSTD